MRGMASAGVVACLAFRFMQRRLQARQRAPRCAVSCAARRRCRAALRQQGCAPRLCAKAVRKCCASLCAGFSASSSPTRRFPCGGAKSPFLPSLASLATCLLWRTSEYSHTGTAGLPLRAVSRVTAEAVHSVPIAWRCDRARRRSPSRPPLTCGSGGGFARQCGRARRSSSALQCAACAVALASGGGYSMSLRERVLQVRVPGAAQLAPLRVHAVNSPHSYSV
jgi:hypothetical protein